MQLTSLVLKTLRRTGQPRGLPDIVAELDRRVTRQQVEKAVGVLVAEGRVVETSSGFSLRPAEKLRGKLRCGLGGNGFVSTPLGDVFVSRRNLHSAWHGDEVEIELGRRPRGPGRLVSGKVTAVVSRANESIVGTLESDGGGLVLRPANKRLNCVVGVSPRRAGGAGPGDVVQVRVDKFPVDGRPARGTVVRVIGGVDEPGVDIDTIVLAHDLPTTFSEPAIAQATSLGAHRQAGEGQYRDLRDLFTVTIDGLDAKDFDDAVSLKGNADGSFDLWVHIANVSSYVPLDSPLDEEAFERGTSVYLPDRVLPMLPEALSNDLCSLRPNEDRLALTVFMRVDAAGQVTKRETFDSVIRSDFRLTYEEVDSYLASRKFPSQGLESLILGLDLLSQVLANKRISRGSLEFETIEPKLVLNEERWPVEVIVRERTPATQIIEEAMILTNETVAHEMMSAGLPMIYRVHDDPDPEAVAAVSQLVRQFGYPIHRLEEAHPRTFQALITFAHNRPERLLINSLLLRAMSQAKYSAKWRGHFGLASEHYTHFTSPIRRYPDLMVHRLVRAKIYGRTDAEEFAKMADRLQEVAEHCSQRERAAQAAEREAVDVKLAQYMLAHIGEEFEAVVSGVTSFGFFVELGNSAEGLVPVQSLRDDYYRFEADRYLLRGQRTNRMFRLGQPVRVRLTDVSIPKRELDFEVV